MLTAARIGNSLTGNITLISDNISVSNSPTITTTGNVIFDPYTSTTAIGINGGAGGEPLQITSGILGAITANTVVIGKADNSDTGLITVAANTDTSANNFGMTFNGSTGGVSLLGDLKTAGTITFNNTAGVSIPAADLTIQSVNGQVNINDDITKASASDATLDVKAGTDIIAIGSTISSAGGKLGVTLDADSADTNGTGTGAIPLSSVDIESNGGNITLGGGTDPTTMAAIGDAANTWSGIYIGDSTLNAGGGNISLIGHEDINVGTNAAGINIYYLSTIETTGNGAITLNGTGGGTVWTGDGGNAGVTIHAGSTISADGDISITGKGGNNADEGIVIIDTGNLNESIYTTGTGNITLNGIATTDSNNATGVGIAIVAGLGNLSETLGSTAKHAGPLRCRAIQISL